MPRLRRLILPLLTWAALTGGGTLLLRAARREAGTPADAGTLSDLLNPLVNLFHLFAAPGRIIAYFTRVIWRWPAWQIDLASLALGSAALIVGLLVANALRRRLAGPTLARASLAPSDQPTDQPASPSRRRLLVNGISAAGAIAATGAAVQAVMIEPQRLVLRRYSVPINNLPSALSGLRIAFLSDTHLGPLVPASHIERAVAEAAALKPDLFLLGGDYVYSFPSPMPRAAELFAPLVATGRPVLAVLGNHDWYDNARAIAQALTALGVMMLDNRRVFLNARTRTITEGSPAGEPCLCIAGLGDLIVSNVHPDRALGGVEDDVPRIVLAHEPDTFELPSLAGPGALRIDLGLCGHTHGGQVRLPLIGSPIIPSQFGQKYEGGVVRAPRCPVVVSRGVGMSGLPVRFGVPPEIVEVTLTCAMSEPNEPGTK